MVETIFLTSEDVRCINLSYYPSVPIILNKVDFDQKSDQHILQEAIYMDDSSMWRIIFNENSSSFFISGSEISKNLFLSTLMNRKPNHFFWIIWHPEILDGRYKEI